MAHALLAAVSGLSLAAVVGFAPSGQDLAAPTVVRLIQGQVLERDMAVGELHRYDIELQAGQYLQVLVEQRGVDVAQTLTGPDGVVVLETDSPCGPIGPDPLAFIATITGVHSLVLTAGDLAVPPRGRYEIRVEAPRAPTSSDLLRVKAVRAGAEALRAMGKDPRTELDRYREALGGWEALGDRRMQMWTDLMIGFGQAFEIDEPQHAQESYQRALATAIELDDEWAEARVSDDLAQVLLRLGRLDETKALMERALALHHAAGRNEGAARMLTVLGSFFSLTGEPQPALDRLYDALRVYQGSGNTTQQARTRIEIGATYLRLGDPELALEHYQLALPGFARDPGRRARCITEMGVARFRLGHRAGARKAHEEALGIFRTLENRIAEADTLLGLGDLDREEGDLDAAMRVVASALSTYQARAYPLGIGNAQCRLGEIHRRLGDAAAARAAFAAVVEIGPAAGDTAQVCAEQGLARVELGAGSLDAAQRHAEAALSRVESLRSVVSHRARAAALASRQLVYELLIDIVMREHEAQPGGGRDVAAFEVSERARARSLLDLLREGHVDVSRGVAPELLAEERSLRGRLNAAAVAQSDALMAGRADRVEALDRDLDRLSSQLAETESRIRRASPQYASLTQAQPLGLAEVRARVLDPDTQLLQYALGDEHSYLWVASAERLESFRLAPRAEIEAAARRVHELASLPPTANRQGTARSALESARAELSHLILAPAVGALRAKRLLVVAPGALQYVPFGLLRLRDDAQMLSRFEVVSAPSASVIATLRGEVSSRDRAGRAVAVFADPVFESSDPRLGMRDRTGAAPVRVASRGGESGEPFERALQGVRGRGIGGSLARLPFSRQEADAIMALAPRKESLRATGFDASRAAATSHRLAEYRIVHFATHGVLNTRRPELSGVVLSLFDDHGQRQDGFLRLHDVYNLRLGADLVVLSGCQTGLGKDLKGEGLVGLTRGFMYAGARSVVASLWQVDDESTAELMKRFYRAMLKDGKRPAAALRAAQLEMSRTRRWSASFYWAGFVLQGEWR